MRRQIAHRLIDDDGQFQHLADQRQLGGMLICQKDAFLCAAKGVSIGIAFQKKLGVGLFGGEGFIMQRLQGDGLAFVHAGGKLVFVLERDDESYRLKVPAIMGILFCARCAAEKASLT